MSVFRFKTQRCTLAQFAILNFALVLCFSVNGCQREAVKPSFGSQGDKALATIEIPTVGPYVADLIGGVSESKWEPFRFRLTSDLHAGQKYLFKGSFEVEPGGSAPQLLDIRMQELSSSGDSTNRVITTVNPNPTFDGPFGTEKSSFEAELVIPATQAKKFEIVVLSVAMDAKKPLVPATYWPICICYGSFANGPPKVGLEHTKIPVESR